MNVWQVQMDGNQMMFGSSRRPMFSDQGCNEPFKTYFWCPRRKWFRKEPCPFGSRGECDTYRRMCGSL